MPVYEIRKTDLYAKWLDGLRDIHARALVQARVERLATGNPGDLSQSVRVSQNCGSTMAPDTECIIRCADAQ